LANNSIIDPSEIEVHSFTTENFNLEEFECEKERFTEYLKKEAKIDHSLGIGRVFLFVYQSKVVGFATVAMSQLPKEKHEKFEAIATHGNVPGLLLGQLARDVKYSKSGLGKHILDWTVNHAIELSERVGCRIIIVKSDEDKIDWYKGYGFISIKNSKDKLFYDILKQS